MGWSWLTLSGHKKAPFLISFVSTLTKEARNKLLCTQESISSTTMATKGAWVVSMRILISSYRGGSSFFFIKNDYFLDAHSLSEIVLFLYHSRFWKNKILSSFVHKSLGRFFFFFFYHYKYIIQIHKMYIWNKQRTTTIVGQQLLWRCQVSTKTFI